MYSTKTYTLSIFFFTNQTKNLSHQHISSILYAFMNNNFHRAHLRLHTEGQTLSCFVSKAQARMRFCERSPKCAHKTHTHAHSQTKA